MRPAPHPNAAFATSFAGLVGRDPAAIRIRVEAMEQALERVWTIPGINRKVGLDALLGLVPVIGDLAAALGSYIIWEARNLGLPRWKIARMMGHVAFDTVLGAVPVVGDAFDLFYRSNSYNLGIIRRHLDRHHPATVTVEA